MPLTCIPCLVAPQRVQAAVPWEDFIARPQAPSVLMMVLFQLLLTLLATGGGCQQIWVAPVTPAVRVTFQIPGGKVYNLWVSVLVLVDTKPRYCVSDFVAGAHPSNRQLLRIYLDNISG